MTKFLLDIILTVCVLVYGAEIRKFTVGTGIQDKVGGYLKTFFDFGIHKSYFIFRKCGS